MSDTDAMMMKDVANRLRAARSAAIFTHQRPDPDALGSQAALALMLGKAGVGRVVVVNWEPVSGPYAFLQEGVETVTFTPEWAARAADFDTFVVVDTCAYQQMEPGAALLRTAHDKVVAIDHHVSFDPIGPMILRDPKAAACVEILTELAHAMDVALDAAIAARLFSGLVADTGWFRFDSVTPRTHRVAAELVAAGAEPARLYERLQQNETAPKLTLMARALSGITLAAAGQVALLVVTQRDFAETGASASQTEDIVNLALMVGTVEVAGLVTEMPDGRVRVSLRSKHAVDVNAVCRQFGGGGHAKAAGCRMDGPPEAAREKMIAAVVAALGTVR